MLPACAPPSPSVYPLRAHGARPCRPDGRCAADRRRHRVRAAARGGAASAPEHADSVAQAIAELTDWPGLVIGSELTFTDRGEHHLKGIPDRWAVYAASV